MGFFMKPLRVTWTFTSPVVNVSDYPTHLDGLVAYTVFEQARSAGSKNPVELSEDLSHVFGVEESVHGPIFQASMLSFDPMAEPFYANFVRRSEGQEWQQAQDAGLVSGRQRTMLESTRGVHRAYFVQYPYQWMRSATAWCIADEVELRAALVEIKSIGKMARNGFGRVKEFSIVEDVQALQKWRMRFLPIDVAGDPSLDYVLSQNLCVRAPYWRRDLAVPAKEPIL